MAVEKTKIGDLEKFYDYDNVLKLLKDQWEATPTEIFYWSADGCLKAYSSDIPSAGETYVRLSVNEKNITSGYFFVKDINGFVATPYMRVIKIADLASTKRNWVIEWDNSRNIIDTLTKAAQMDLLSMFDKSSGIFVDSIKNMAGEYVNWIDTPEGQEYLLNDSSPLLLREVITIERVLLGRPYMDCMVELGWEK